MLVINDGTSFLRHTHVPLVRMTNEWERLFGKRVQDLRLAMGWTQEDLAQRMTDAGHPMHQTTVTKLEKGTRPTSVAEVGALSTLFDVSIGAIFGGGDELDALRRMKASTTRIALIRAEIQRILEERASHQARIDELTAALQDETEVIKAIYRDYPDMDGAIASISKQETSALRVEIEQADRGTRS
jgi:transcriptional regulator with XRE-family HTH domain